MFPIDYLFIRAYLAFFGAERRSFLPPGLDADAGADDALRHFRNPDAQSSVADAESAIADAETSVADAKK